MVGQHHGVEYCDTLDIDNIIVGAGRISRRWHEQRDAGQAMDFAHGLHLGPNQQGVQSGAAGAVASREARVCVCPPISPPSLLCGR